MSESRRREVYDLVCKYDLLVCEDDPYFILQYGQQVNEGRALLATVVTLYYGIRFFLLHLYNFFSSPSALLLIVLGNVLLYLLPLVCVLLLLCLHHPLLLLLLFSFSSSISS